MGKVTIKPTICSAARSRGFTLIEVAVALLILGGSLLVLLGLQSSIIDRTVRDTKKQRAMLLARQILSAVEISTQELNPMSTSGTIPQILSDVLPVSDTNAPPPDPDDADYKAQLDIESLGIPGIADDLLRKVTVTVWWSPSPIDRISAVYFTGVQ